MKAVPSRILATLIGKDKCWLSLIKLVINILHPTFQCDSECECLNLRLNPGTILRSTLLIQKSGGNMKDYYKINEISNLYGIGVDSLRYYEKIGVLIPRRDTNGYRLYGLHIFIN